MSRFYFAWIAAPVDFDPVVHAVEDEAITELQLTQSEGDFAGLNMTVINPHTGLLAPGRKQWCWLSWDNGEEIVPLFTGRLVAVPEAITGEAIRLLFAARPPDYDNAKRDYAETLKVLPYYDPVWITGEVDDPDVVLNGYGAQWHIDRVTLDVTHSDELVGEDGTLTIGEADHVYDSFTAAYSQPPLSRVDLDATLAWTQSGRGTIDVGMEVYQAARVQKSIYTHPKGGVISTLTGDGLKSDWPKPGNDFGGGWTVNAGTIAFDAPKGFKRYNYQVQFRQLSAEAQTAMHAIAANEDGSLFGDLSQIATTATTYFGGYTDYQVDFPIWAIEQFALFDWAADRGRTEIVRCSLVADIQALLAEPGAAENVGKISISAQDTITEPDDAGNMAVEDTRRASYLNTDRGNLSVQYLLLLGRAELRRRARAIDLQCRVSWPVGIAATLRSNAHVVDRRLPGGEAIGKITGYSMSADGNSGDFHVDLTVACAVGHGGSVTAAAGTPDYVDLGYVGAGYQQMTGAEIMLPVGDLVYQSFDKLPISDDGLDLLHFDRVQAVQSITLSGGLNDQIQLVTHVEDPIEALGHLPTRFCFHMRPVAGMNFETVFTPSVKPLPIPQQINLEA
jgi:hypothetical protein